MKLGQINVEQKHSPDGKKRDGAGAAKLGGPLVMQVVPVGVRRQNIIDR